MNFSTVLATADSESDHEPSSTVTIATPPRSADTDSTSVDKQSRTSVDTGRLKTHFIMKF